MGQEHNSTSYRRGKHFNWEERLILEKDMLTIIQMAIILDRHERSIRRELKRGSVTLQNSDLSAYMTYSADIGQRKARRELEAKGPALKLGADYKFVKETQKLLKKKYSPDSVIMHYKKYSWPTGTRISTKTLYRYIYEGLLGNARIIYLGAKGGARRAQMAIRGITERNQQ